LPQTKGISDARGAYYRYSGLLNVMDYNWEPSYQTVKQGKKIRNLKKDIFVSTGIGYLGYYAGPATYLVDVMSLADPLLSKLSCANKHNWVVGHFRRDLPEGYFESLKNDRNLIKNAQIKKLYASIREITRGRLFSIKRIATIIRYNLQLLFGSKDINGYDRDDELLFYYSMLYDTTCVCSGDLPSEFQYVPGDILKDGEVNKRDFAYLKGFFVGLNDTPTDSINLDNCVFYPAIDVNGDCRITASDISYLQKYLRGIVKELKRCPNISFTR
jgi:hypothetical protein